MWDSKGRDHANTRPTHGTPSARENDGLFENSRTVLKEKKPQPDPASSREPSAGPRFVLAPLLFGLAATLFSGLGMALGARQAVSIVDQGADDLARWIELPLTGAGAGKTQAERGTSRAARTSETPVEANPRSRRTRSASAKGRAPRRGGLARAQDTPANEKPEESEKTRSGPTTKRTAQAPEATGPSWLTAALDAPRCAGISAYIISAFERSENSVATLSTDPRRLGRQRRVGEKFGEYRVIRIDYNARRMSSAVWLTKDSEVCQVLLRAEHPVRERLQRKADRQRRATLTRARKEQRRTLKRFEKRQRRKKRIRRRARSGR
jgi:hypothetical protein